MTLVSVTKWLIVLEKRKALISSDFHEHDHYYIMNTQASCQIMKENVLTKR